MNSTSEALASYQAAKARADVYRELRENLAARLNADLAVIGAGANAGPSARREAFANLHPAQLVAIETIEAEVHRLADMVRDSEIAAGQIAAACPSVLR